VCTSQLRTEIVVPVAGDCDPSCMCLWSQLRAVTVVPVAGDCGPRTFQLRAVNEGSSGLRRDTDVRPVCVRERESVWGGGGERERDREYVMSHR